MRELNSEEREEKEEKEEEYREQLMEIYHKTANTIMDVNGSGMKAYFCSLDKGKRDTTNGIQ